MASDAGIKEAAEIIAAGLDGVARALRLLGNADRIDENGAEFGGLEYLNM